MVFIYSVVRFRSFMYQPVCLRVKLSIEYWRNWQHLLMIRMNLPVLVEGHSCHTLSLAGQSGCCAESCNRRSVRACWCRREPSRTRRCSPRCSKHLKIFKIKKSTVMPGYRMNTYRNVTVIGKFLYSNWNILFLLASFDINRFRFHNTKCIKLNHIKVQQLMQRNRN